MKRTPAKNKPKMVASKVHSLLAGRVSIGLAGILVGLGCGFLLWNQSSQDVRYELASSAAIKQARQDITAEFQAASSTECSDGTDPIKPQDRVEVFQKYLKVNKYANRAVIRGCNNIDALLAKGLDGKWFRTSVNVALDARANASWQAECLIDDITVTDDKTRPENSSIDVTNMVLCRNLKEREQVFKILSEGAGQNASQQEVDSFIESVDGFVEKVGL